MDNNTASNEPVARNASTPPSAPGGEMDSSISPKKRRKVNHACIYCRRSHMTCDLERPCTRCVKRNIGHLCHDEPREPVRRAKSDQSHTAGDEEMSLKQEETSAPPISSSIGQQQTDQRLLQQRGLGATAPTAPENRHQEAQTVQASPISAASLRALGGNQQFSSYNNWSSGNQSQFHDMHTFHPSYMFNAPEVTHEYNLLNDFLSNSLLDDGAIFQGEDAQGLYGDPPLISAAGSGASGSNGQYLPNLQRNQPLILPPSSLAPDSNVPRPASTMPIEKAKEAYYMTAADPSGSDAPEDRMNKLLKAKYDAGMLRPFNYVNGYARLNKYMDQHMQPVSRQKILRQLDKFRPKFRERMQTLTDIELVLVEMWFERSLMEYDRVFASMAVPACCWRRTGEIFRGNKEMAELIHVPIEKLRDGKLAIHEIIVEDQLVSYWEKFGAIAFDNLQKAMLTSCSLRNPELKSTDPKIHCCFSFTIRRDNHDIPSLIVGNFLPMSPNRK